MIGPLREDYKEGDEITATDLNQILHYLRALGKFTVSGGLEMYRSSAGTHISARRVGVSLVCCAANGSNSVTLSAGGEDIPFASGQQNGITIDAANDRLEIETDGDYLFIFNFYVEPTSSAASTDDNWQFDFQINGTGHSAWSHVRQLINYSSTNNNYQITLMAYAECEEGDLITVHAENIDDATRTIDILAVSLFAVKLTLG